MSTDPGTAGDIRHREAATAEMIRQIESKIARLNAARTARKIALVQIRSILAGQRPSPDRPIYESR